jgi:hypothetical protein
MSDWEEELEKEEKGIVEEKKEKTGYEDESEDIIKPKIEPKKQQLPKEPLVDYEKKYLERHKDDIEIQKEIEKATEGINDKDLKLKMKLELENIKRAEKFLGKDENKGNQFLNVEKDYISLAQKNAAKINSVKKPLQYTFSYLKQTIDSLLPNLESEQINELIKVINIIFNKKLKDEGFGKKKDKKPSIVSNKRIERNDRKGLYDEYIGKNDYDEEEEFEDDEMEYYGK